MYSDNIDLLKKLQELFSTRKKTLNPKTQTEELRQLITQIIMLQIIIDRNDNNLTNEEELQLQKLSENKNYAVENFIIKIIILLHKSKNKQDPLSHIELAKNFADNGFYQKAAEYYQWVVTNSKNSEFLRIACYSLGMFYAQEKLQPEDSSENRFDIAIGWFKKSAIKKFSPAYFNLGCLYEKKMSFVQAKIYYIKFIQAHDPMQPCSPEVHYAIYRCARMAALGLGMEKNLVEAKDLYGNLVKLYSYRDAMFDLAEILFEEKECFQAKQFYELFIAADKPITNDQDLALKKMEALYKLELIEKTEKAVAAESLKQKKLQKKLNKSQSKPIAKSTAAIDMEAMILMADELLQNKKYKESKKQFLAIKTLIDNASNKFDFLTLNEKNIVCYVKCLWGMANCLFALNKLAGANNLYKESLGCIEAYIANHKELDELVGIRYSIEVDAKAIAVKLNFESPDAKADEQPSVVTQKTQKWKSKKKKKPAKLTSIFGSEVEREILNVVIPDRAMCILNVLKGSGITPYIYGGFIRDSLLKIDPSDVDIISKTSFEKVKRALQEYFNKNVGSIDPKYIPKKIQSKKKFHGIVIHYADGEHIDITTFRDYDNKDHYDPNKVGNFSTHSGTYDLTINGLLLNPFTKEIIDLMGGVADLREKKLRVNDPERFFKLDPARMLRVIRFAARFPDFTIIDQDKIFKFMDDYCYMLNDSKKISRGKLFEEVSALFSGGIGLASYKLLKATKLLPFLFPHFPVLKSQGYLETKFFSFDMFIENVLEQAKTAPKPERYGLPLIFAVILWPLLLDQLIKCNKQFDAVEENVRKLQVFDIYNDVWDDIKLIWVIHYYKTVPLTMNNKDIHFMAETFSELAAKANKDWKDVKKMFAEKKEQALRYSEISQLPQVFSLFSLESYDTAEPQKTVSNTL